MIRARATSNVWQMNKAPKTNSGGMLTSIQSLRKTYAVGRITASFEYIGSALPKDEAEKIWNTQKDAFPHLEIRKMKR